VADWPVQHPCEKCGTRTQYRVWVADANVALCGRCWLVRFGRDQTMADQAKDSGPYHLYGRRTALEPEIRVGSHDNLDKARSECDDMVDSGVWAHASVRNRDDLTVHVGEVTGGRDKGTDDDDGGPDA
jgi:ribosome-binding protein aMBF1 (putative translation factor)